MIPDPPTPPAPPVHDPEPELISKPAASSKQSPLFSQPFPAPPRSGVRFTLLLMAGLHLLPAAMAACFSWQAGLGTLAALHAMLLATTLNVHSRLFGSARRTVPMEGKSLCLTIDDGPCEDTAAMLDLLEAHGAKAVFFLIGERAAARPEDVREILRRGHQIGNHTQTHPAGQFWIYGPWSQRREIGNCQETLTALSTGAVSSPRPGLFRAPAGFRNPFTAPVLREFDLEAWGWQARGFDTSCTDVPRILHRLTANLKPGAILLIHQGQHHHCNVLRQLLENLSANGWHCRLPDP